MATDYQKAQENYERYAYARDSGHLDFVHKAERCDAYFIGEQWDPSIRRRLERKGKPVLTINKILPALMAVFGEYLGNRADVSFRPAVEGTPEIATALDKLWLHIANQNELDWLESEVFADGVIRSRGFYDVRVQFDDNMRGNVVISLLNSKNVLMDPDAETYDPDGWKEVFVTKWLTHNDIAHIYGPSVAKELKARGVSDFNMRYDSVDWTQDSFGSKHRAVHSAYSDDPNRRLYRIVERQYKELKRVDHFVDRATGSVRRIPDTWDRERVQLALQTFGFEVTKREIEVIRWTQSTDSILLFDEVSPYRHYTPVPFFPIFRHGTTVGLVENIISPQDLLNKVTSQELHIVNTTANSGYIVKAGVLANMTLTDLEERGGEDGLVIETNDVTGVVKIQPNQVPTGLDRISFKTDEALKEVSMVSDSMRGFDRADVAAKAIQAKQARGTVSLAKPFENLAQTRKILARNVLDLIQQFYTEERIINVTGNNLTDEPEQLALNQLTPEGTVANDLTVGTYDVVITLSPARDTFEQSQFAEALALRQQGVAIPDDVLVEHSHLNRKGEIAKRMKDIAGGGEPTEAMLQMQQMEAQLKQLEMAEKQADVQLKQANAQLSAARAQSEMNGQNGEAKLAMEQQMELQKLAFEREKFAQELALEKEKLIAELAMKREQIHAEAALKRETAAVDMQVKRETAAIDMQNRRDSAIADMALRQQETEANVAMQREQMTQDHGLRREQQAGDMEIKREQVKNQASLARAKQRAQPKGAPSR